jgi:hypothetical protein
MVQGWEPCYISAPPWFSARTGGVHQPDIDTFPFSLQPSDQLPINRSMVLPSAFITKTSLPFLAQT